MSVKAFIKGMLIGAVLLAGVILVQNQIVMAQEDCPAEVCSSPSPVPVVKTLDLGKDGPHCGDSHFYVNAVVKKDGVEQVGVEVTFKYKSETLKAKTNKEGRAQLDMPFKGDDKISAKAGGYPSQSIGVSSRGADDCPVEVKVTKMAKTGKGVSQDWLTSMILGGGLLALLGVGLYVKKD